MSGDQETDSQKKMEENFVCPICMECADEAVETACCHNIFCAKCLNSIKEEKCPTCRAKKPRFSFEVSHLARRLIGCMEMVCLYGCGSKFPRSERNGHEVNCGNKPYSCPSQGCAFSGISEAYLNHLITEHKNAVLQYADKIFKGPISNEFNLDIDRIKTSVNSRNQTVRLGESGKYYCKMDLGDHCSCCNGYCGPTNGCNCSSCMKLDVYVRRLPKYWFVNRDGAACRMGTTGKFYCGRRVMTRNQRTDGYCGPTNGQNCFACQAIDSQAGRRYADVWS